MRKQTLYLETSVWNFLHADESPEKMSATRKLFNEISEGGYAIYVSDIVINEILKAPCPRLELLADDIAAFAPIILKDTEEAREMVAFYLNNSLLSENHSEDLGHLAVATVNAIDILVSWNMRHIVRRKTRRYVNALNQIKGYNALDICTPEEVIDYDEDS